MTALGLIAWLPHAVALEPTPSGVLPTSNAASVPGQFADGPDLVALSPLAGAMAMPADELDSRRGGANVHNDMQLDGVVGSNSASNLVTGANTISSGSFTGSSGLPVVIQNSGNNVLIQNATIVNVQIK